MRNFFEKELVVCLRGLYANKVHHLFLAIVVSIHIVSEIAVSKL